jgi:hypothetical protein
VAPVAEADREFGGETSADRFGAAERKKSPHHYQMGSEFVEEEVAEAEHNVDCLRKETCVSHTRHGCNP